MFISISPDYNIQTQIPSYKFEKTCKTKWKALLDDIYSRYRLNKTTHSYADMIIKLIAIKV